MVLGLQQDYQVAATSKHYIAYSNNKGAREGMSRVDPQMPPHEVENIHVYPWREVIARGGLLGVMSAYNDYDGYPIQSSGYWLGERLRKDFGFRGYVVSDSDAVEYLHTKHRVSPDMKESVYQSVMAGLNVRCTFRSPDSYVLPLRELVREGRIPMRVIDERVRDILRVKFLVGLLITLIRRITRLRTGKWTGRRTTLLRFVLPVSPSCCSKMRATPFRSTLRG